MARKYHNLDGLLRDLIAGMEDDGDGWSRLVQFARIIADILEILDDGDDDSGLPDADDSSGGGSPAQMELPEQGDGTSMGGHPPRHDTLRADDLVRARGLEPTLERGDPHTYVQALARSGLRSGPGDVVRADIGRRLVGGAGVKARA